MSRRTKQSLAALLRSPFNVIMLLVLAWFCVALLIWPTLNLLINTFVVDGQFSFSSVERLGRSDRAIRALTNSFLLAFLLSLSVNIVGIFIVLVTRYFNVWGSRILWLGYATTLIYGGIVLAAAYKMIYGPGGLIGGAVASLPGVADGWFTGLPAVLFTMTLGTTTNHLLFVSPALSAIDGQMLEAGRMMGASNWTMLRKVVLPMLRPVLFAVTILSFLTGLGALSAPQVLGGRDFQTITPIILTFTGTTTSRDIAALLAIILGLATVVLLYVLTRVERSGTYFSVAKVSTRLTKQKIENPVGNVILHVAAWGLWLLYMLPVVLIVIFSFVEPNAAARGQLTLEGAGFGNYVRVLTQSDALRPFMVSIGYSAIAAVVVGISMMITGWMVQRYRNPITVALEYLLHIPWILPATMIALGLIISYDHTSPLMFNVVLTGTPIILAIAYIIVKIPFTLRLLKSAFASVNTSLEEAARLMGASTLTIFRRILLPAILPAAAAVTALNFNSLLDDYDTAVFLAHPLYQPLGLVIQANTTGSLSPVATSNTYVYTVLLMLITGTVMYLVYGRTGTPRKRKKDSAATQPAETSVRDHPVTESSQ